MPLQTLVQSLAYPAHAPCRHLFKALPYPAHLHPHGSVLLHPHIKPALQPARTWGEMLLVECMLNFPFDRAHRPPPRSPPPALHMPYACL
eukprot:1154631-Pelagomonas_calceolata.AAC.2